MAKNNRPPAKPGFIPEWLREHIVKVIVGFLIVAFLAWLFGDGYEDIRHWLNCTFFTTDPLADRC